MKTKLLVALTMAAAALGSQTASAYDGTITFNGAITATTCTINGGTPDLLVTLPTVQHTAVDNNGEAGRTPFAIKLTACTGSAASVRTYFEPISSNIDAATGYLKDTSAGAATNVQIQLLNDDATPIDLRQVDGAQGAKLVPIVSNAATLNYFAQYKGINSATVTSGSVNSSVVYSLSYQ